MTRGEEKTLGGALAAVLAVPLVLLFAPLSLPLAIWDGYALRIVWGWFAVPSLGVKPLSLTAAAGLIIMARFVTHQIDGTDAKQKAWYVLMAAQTIGPLVLILTAWMIRWVLGSP